ncbi:MAG: hypothetical protein DMG05_11920 [Acidobacteria bacterium]|nr:MAG: hypothetical protein DMG05_11920 [Acidobacteriota bacterium]
MAFQNKSCKLQLEIQRTAFVDYDSFVQTLARNAQLAIEQVDETLRIYTLSNQWKTSLNRNGNIELSSPLLTGEQAVEARQLLQVLRSMNVKVGENCRSRIRYSSSSAIISNLPSELIWGSALALFLVTKTIELQFQFQRALLWQGIFFMQVLGYLFFMVFAIFLSKGISRKSKFEESLGTDSPQPETASPDETKLRVQPSASGMGKEPSTSAQVPEPNISEITREIKDPLENIVAYTRFYQSTIDKESQHWKDLVEIMEQAIRIQEIVNRVESMTCAREIDTPHSSQIGGKNLFRRTPRTIELIPLAVRGYDALGEPFETASYTLNVSPRGACVLFPDKAIKVGQKIDLQNHHFATEAMVRWIVQGKAGNMVFAGVDFTKPIKMLLKAQSA